MNQVVIDKIKSIEAHFGAINNASGLKLSRHEVNTIGEIYKQLEPSRRLNLSCANCVEVALTKIAYFYEQWKEANTQIEVKLETTKKIKKK